jgi:hypothetical protein
MLGKGTKLTGSVTGLIGHIRNPNFAGRGVDDLDNTDCDTAGYHRTYEPGLINSGQFTCELVYNVTYAYKVEQALKNRVTECWCVQFADNTKRYFWGYPNSTEMALPYDALSTYNFGIKITGEVKSSSSSSSSSSSISSSSSSSSGA